LQFVDQAVTVGLPAAPVIGPASAGTASATVTFTSPPTSVPPVTSFTIRVTNTGTGVTSLITGVPAAATSRVVTGLTNGQNYTFAVAAVNALGTGAFSADSNAVTPLLAVPPVVVGRVPAAGATGVAVGANITAGFSRVVQGVSTGANSTNVVLATTAGGLRVPAAVSGGVLGVFAPGLPLTINPVADLLPGTSYTVTITGGSCAPAGGIRSVGTPCAALATTSWTFTTDVANPAPTVTSTTPVANAVNVVRAANITATFSENVQGVGAATARLTRNGTVIATAVTYNPATNTVTIDPTLNLRRNSVFTVTLIGGPAAIRDLTNLPLATRTWSFTTAP
jgi:methionine-rich copper-binding protein CopC